MGARTRRLPTSILPFFACRLPCYPVALPETLHGFLGPGLVRCTLDLSHNMRLGQSALIGMLDALRTAAASLEVLWLDIHGPTSPISANPTATCRALGEGLAGCSRLRSLTIFAGPFLTAPCDAAIQGLRQITGIDSQCLEYLRPGTHSIRSCKRLECILRNAFIRNHALLPWLRDLRQQCPALKTLWIDTQGANITPECSRALVMMRSLPSLTSLRLWIPLHPKLMEGLRALRWAERLSELHLNIQSAAPSELVNESIT